MIRMPDDRIACWINGIYNIYWLINESKIWHLDVLCKEESPPNAGNNF
jgi:hypothetical protein